jgi:hypothetical protein
MTIIGFTDDITSRVQLRLASLVLRLLLLHALMLLSPAGVVSRIEMTEYSHSGRLLLALQVCTALDYRV